MKKIVLTFGLLSGGVVSAIMLIALAMMKGKSMDFDSGEVLGYASMIVALSLVFFGIKSFRDNVQNGSIRFWKGMQVGTLITLIASLMYSTTWEVYYQADSELRSTFMSNYTEHLVKKMKERGASETEVEAKVREMQEMSALYENPFIRFGFTLLEILPVGILITLISATILRKKTVLPAEKEV
jgi:hypothetical protein